MKKTYINALIFAIILCVSGFITLPKKNIIKKDMKGFAVVELFTSEGCSSCPPADRTVATLLQKNMDNVYILAYHVDYWNRLGWKDVYSKAEYSSRQGYYASHFSSSSVYTPQIIVNGDTEFVGSDEEKLNNTVSGDLQNNQTSDLNISVTKNNDAITVAYDIKEKESVFLNVALIQPQATTNVKGGENGGSILHHVNIVRDLTTISAAGKGTTIVVIPKDLSALPLKLIAFTQSKSTLHILGAAKKESL